MIFAHFYFLLTEAVNLSDMNQSLWSLTYISLMRYTTSAVIYMSDCFCCNNNNKKAFDVFCKQLESISVLLVTLGYYRYPIKGNITQIVPNFWVNWEYIHFKTDQLFTLSFKQGECIWGAVIWRNLREGHVKESLVSEEYLSRIDCNHDLPLE